MGLEKKDQDHLDKEKLEEVLRELEKMEKEQHEEGGFEKEGLEQERLDQETLERERLEKEKMEKERLEREMLERERLEQETFERERMERERLEKERLEKEQFERLKMENKLYPNYSLFMIPSWSDLLGYPTLGTYVNHPVSKIETDTVIFFSGYDYSIETAKGTLHYLFGLGYYFLKFELESGKYVTDNRILTGLVLPDFVYDHMATSANITLAEDRDVIIAEQVIKIPIDLSNKSEDHLTFIKGALMRNVFIPNKDIFLEMIGKIRDVASYQISNRGHELLSAHWDFYDQILVSDKMKAVPDPSYIQSTAGLEGITFAADELLEETMAPMNLTIIQDTINTLKRVYSQLEFDPMYLFSILERASLMLRSNMAPVASKLIGSVSQKTSKASIFASAESRLYEFISWPPQFTRKAKKEPKELPRLVEAPPEWDRIETKRSDRGTVKTREIEQEAFELETLKSGTVEVKPLPPPPEADIKQILLYLKQVIEENHDMRSIGRAFELAREKARQMGVSATTLHQAKIWEMSKYANIYVKKDPSLGLPEKEKANLARKIDEWIFKIEETERLERERLEKARLEKERLERQERERIEREKQEMERRERERFEQIRLEQEQLAQEQLEKEQLKQIEREKQEALRIERERLEQIQREKEEALRLEQERLEKQREEREAIKREKEEIRRLKRERKQKEKEAKQEEKRRKKLEKQKKKLEKKKLKEQEKLKNL
jgi:hypothetical protein